MKQKNFFVLSVSAALEEQVSGRKILEKIIQYHQEDKAELTKFKIFGY